VRSRLSGLRLTPTREAEIVEELSQHLEDRYREAVAGGMSPDEATRLALADFRDGNVLADYIAPLRQAHPPAEITPGAPGSRLLSDLWQDLRYAARTLWKRPGFTVAAVLTLAIGIGANVAIFTVINSILLRPLPFPHSEQLVALYTRYLPASGFDFPYFSISGPEFADVRSRVNGFEGVAGYMFYASNLTRGNEEPERVLTMGVTPDFFDVLGVRPVRGRSFTEDGGRSADVGDRVGSFRSATVHHSRDVVLCRHRVFPCRSRSLRNPRVQRRTTSSRDRRPRRAWSKQTRDLSVDNRKRSASRAGGNRRRRSLGARTDAAYAWNAVRHLEQRSSDVHSRRWNARDLGGAGELLAGSPRHTRGPNHSVARGVAGTRL
jgi:hypothetical protein